MMLCASLLIPGMPVALQDAPRISRPPKALGADALRVKLAKTELTSGEIKPIRSTKAAFAPLDVKAKLGRVPADSDDVTLDGGRKIKYGDYKKWRDSFETSLNGVGFSLKDPGTTFKVRSAAAPELGQMQLQRQQLLTEGTPGALTATRGLQDKLTPIAINTKILPKKIGTVLVPTERTVNITKTFSKQLGISVANLKLNADLNINGKVSNLSPTNAQGIQDIDSEFHLTAHGTANGTLLKKTFELARAEGGYDTNKKTDTVKMHASLFVAGQQLLNDNRTLTGTQRRGTINKQRSVEFGGQASIPVFGPISVSAEFGVRGNAGLRANYNLAGSSLNGEVNPFVDVDGYAEGAVGIGAFGIDIAKVGAYANLTFAKLDMKLGANVGLGVRNKDVLLFEGAHWHNDLELLSGEMGVFVKTPEVSVFGVTIVDAHRYDAELFDFTGFKTSSFLINQSKETVIGQVAG
ncbi:MAG: hypothetical protein QM758_24470 [Armatimonas sp.]